MTLLSGKVSEADGLGLVVGKGQMVAVVDYGGKRVVADYGNLRCVTKITPPP